MVWLLAIVTGILTGSVVGFLAERLRIASLVQSVGAALVAALVSVIATPIVWSLIPHEVTGLAAVSFGIYPGFLMYPIGIGAVVAGLHVLLGRLGARHRAVLLGCVGGLSGALPMASAISLVNRLP